MQPDTTFFTADLHFGDVRLIQDRWRPQRRHDSADEMDNFIISRWNRTVPKDATVYLLGDVSFHDDEKTAAIIDKLNGSIVLVRGNYDATFDDSFYDSIGVEVYPSVADIRPRGQWISMCHYPIAIWNHMSEGGWMLHGHTHGKYDRPHKRILDVGWDNAYRMLGEYRPFSFNDIQEILS